MEPSAPCSRAQPFFIEPVGTLESQLAKAIADGDERLVTELLALGADVTASADDSGLTPLHMAAKSNSINIARGLIAAGARVDARVDIFGKNFCIEKDVTPLHIAALYGTSEIVALFTDAGAPVDALAKGYVTNAERNFFLLEGITPLHVAAQRGDVLVMEALLNAKASVDHAPPNFRVTPLHMAVACNHPDAVDILLTAGANSTAEVYFDGLSHKYDFYLAPIHIAAIRRHIDVINVLLRHGVDINAPTGTGQSTSPTGGTALHLAAQRNNHDSFTERLLELGADPHARDSEGCTPLHIAVIFSRESRVDPLVPKGAYSGYDVAELLLANHADVNAVDLNGLPPLYWAVKNDRLPFVRLFLSRGANPNSKGPEGTPLSDLTSNPAIVDALGKRVFEKKVGPTHWITTLFQRVLCCCRDDFQETQ